MNNRLFRYLIGSALIILAILLPIMMGEETIEGYYLSGIILSSYGSMLFPHDDEVN